MTTHNGNFNFNIIFPFPSKLERHLIEIINSKRRMENESFKIMIKYAENFFNRRSFRKPVAASENFPAFVSTKGRQRFRFEVSSIVHTSISRLCSRYLGILYGERKGRGLSSVCTRAPKRIVNTRSHEEEHGPAAFCVLRYVLKIHR